MNTLAFGLPFWAGTQKSTLQKIMDLAQAPKAQSVIFANAHVVVESEKSLELKNLIKRASLVVPDGVPISWVLKAKGEKQATRYSGPDLMVDLFKAASGSRHFFLGSTPEVLELISGKFPGHAVGLYSPPMTKDYFDEAELKKQRELVEKSQADFVWVGLGAPKQERYVVEQAAKAKSGVWLAVGAAFDFYAGLKPRAPKVMQRLGLEWAFRMLTEPRRLTKRYLTTNPQFLRLALKELWNPSSQKPQS